MKQKKRIKENCRASMLVPKPVTIHLKCLFMGGQMRRDKLGKDVSVPDVGAIVRMTR